MSKKMIVKDGSGVWVVKKMPEKIVRCKDCVYYANGLEEYCDVLDTFLPNEDFYCAFGKAKEEEGESDDER